MSSAMGNKDQPRDPGEAEMLAPWHITGKLDQAEAREVEELAKEDAEFARLIEEVKARAEGRRRSERGYG